MIHFYKKEELKASHQTAVSANLQMSKISVHMVYFSELFDFNFIASLFDVDFYHSHSTLHFQFGI